MIAIVDYGMGNLRSVQKAFEAVGSDALITSDPETLLNADSLVLPGVGAFKDCMSNLEKLNLVSVLRDYVDSGKPFLGICLGLQLLFEKSVEFGSVQGLGILPGTVKRFELDSIPDGGEALKVPHMGWNTLSLKKPSPLFEGVPPESYFYFVHSFHVLPEQAEVVATTTHYGIDFVSGVSFDNVHAFQFHPEKSQKLGLTLLKNFSRLK